MDYIDLIDICGIIVICIGCFVFAPILMYYLHEFIRLKDSDIMKHRKSKLVYLKSLLSIIGIIFERLFVCSVTVWNIKLFDSYKWLIYVFDGVFIWGVFLLFFIKIWLLFYSIEYHQSIGKLTWKKQINSEYKSWYILHKNSFGNFNFILKILILPFILYIFIEIYVEITFLKNVSNHSFIISSLLLLIPSFILYYKLPKKIDDTFGIKKEIGYQCIILFIIMLLYIALFIVDMYFTINPMSYQINNKSDYVRLEWLLRIFIGSITLFSMSFISTKFPVALYNQRILDEMPYLEHQPSHSQIPSNEYQHSHGVKSMIYVLSDEQGFKAFMMHLVNEFSSENLLFIYEYVQIKHEFQMKCNKLIKIPKPKSKISAMRGRVKSVKIDGLGMEENKISIEDDKYITVDFHVEDKRIISRPRTRSSLWNNNNIRTDTGIASYIFNANGTIFSRIELPPNLPKCQLLGNKEKFIDRLYELYLKYIKRGSILEINISCIQRKRITKSFNEIIDKITMENGLKNNEQISDSMENIGCIDDERNEVNFNMFNVMDGACIEILLLMSQSYTRFARSPHGAKTSIVQKINNMGDIELIDYRKKALSLEILRNGSSYSKLRTKYEI